MPALRSYAAKFLFVAFVGTHIPLIGLAFFLAATGEFQDMLPIFLVGLAFTLLTTGATLLALHHLLAPVRLASRGLQQYFDDKVPPKLPEEFPDEAGRLLRNLSHALQQLDALLESKQDQLAQLAHNLRQPIQSIKALTGFIREDSQSSDIHDYANKIDLVCEQQLSRAGGTLLQLRQDKLHGIKLEPRPTLLAPLVHQVLSVFEGSIRDRELRFITQFDHDLHLQIDAQAFSQVLENLIGNAIKYSLPGQQICLSATKHDNWIQVQVADQGRGFQPDYQHQLFHRFEREEHHGNIPATDGEGLGLYLSRRIVEAHGGTIRAFSSGRNQGSTFTVELPLSRA
jgi:signal transduction histidine kinase